MLIHDAKDYTGERPWAALDLLHLHDATVRLHWTDAPYVWHVNDGPEVFVVLDGAVDMDSRDSDGAERTDRLTPGRVCVVEPGDEHVARPVGAARILVIERAGSI